MLAFGFKQEWLLTRTQALWFHIYFVYFLTGMVLSRFEDEFPKMFSNTMLLLNTVVWGVSSVIYWYQINNLGVIPAQHYGSGYYTIWLISFFIIVISVDKLIFPNYMKRVLSVCATNSFSVYLGHLPTLIFITKIRPLYTLSDAVICIFSLFIGWVVIAEIFKKLPLLRKIV